MTPSRWRGRRLRAFSFLTLAVTIVGVCALISLIGLRVVSDAEVTGFAEMITAVASAGGVVATYLLRKWDSIKKPPDLPQTAADRLAESLMVQWKEVAKQRHLDGSPQTISMRWKFSDSHAISDDMESVVNSSREIFPPLPDVRPATSGMLASGGVADLFPVYAGLPSGRLVIVGEPGMGKSAAGIQLLLDALRHRQGIAEPERQRVPVPVLLTAHSWRTSRHGQSLEQWLASRLKNDLASLLPGADPEIATQLVEEGKVSLILDGFDEMTEDLLRQGLDDLHDELPFRLVLLTRLGEFEKAIGTGGGGRVQRAAVLELQPVSEAVAAHYLRRAFAPGLVHFLDPMLDHLREQPASALARALGSPLMLSLMYDILHRWSSGRDTPENLSANIRKLTDQENVETYLLHQVLPLEYDNRRRIAYGDRPPGEKPLAHYRLDRAQRWLGYIAHTMKDDGNARDLEWWELHEWSAKLPRILITTFAIGIPTMFGVWFVFHSSNFSEIKSLGPLIGPAMGLIVGIGVGLFMERGKPAGDHPDRSRQGHDWGRWFIARFNSPMFNAPVGMLAGIVTGVAVGAVLSTSNRWMGLVAGLAVGLFCCFASGLASGIGATDREAAQGTSRSGVRRMLSRFSPLVAVACGLPVVAAISFAPAKGSLPGSWLPAEGVAFGVSLAVAFGLLDGFSKPEVGATVPTDPADSLRRDFRESLEVGLPFGLAIGLVGGIGIAGSSGWLKGLLAGIAIGAVGVLVAGVAVSDRWRTMLVFLQLWSHGHAPLRGLRFLRDAHESRKVLRIVGPAYQFRHALLQDMLAREYAESRGLTPATHYSSADESAIAAGTW